MKQNDWHRYKDIINLPHHVAKKHPQMPAMNRAAQFAPFAALTGHGAAIAETARQTDSFMELDEDQKEQLDRQLGLIQRNLGQKPAIEATYFQPDAQKEGGAYITVRGRVAKINLPGREILLADGTALPIDRLRSIRGALFGDTELPDT